MNQSLVTPMRAKYNNSRLSLLLVVVFSVINIFTLIFSQTYFLFSAYIPQSLVVNGILMSVEGGQIYLTVAVVLAAIAVLPYPILWIFSKKHVGCMIAALVLFSIDSALFLIDFVLFLLVGDFSMIIDLIFHAWALVSLALGVKYGFAAKKEAAEASEAPIVAEHTVGDYFAMADTGAQRKITVTRKKSFVGMAVPIVFYVGQTEVCRVKNGETVSFEVGEGAFTLSGSISSGMGAGSIDVPAGSADLQFEAVIKSGLTASTVQITSVNML